MSDPTSRRTDPRRAGPRRAGPRRAGPRREGPRWEGPGSPGPWWVGRRRPITLAIGLVVIPALISVAIGLVGTAAGGDPLVWRLVAVLAVMAGALTVVATARAWRRIGAAGPVTWRRSGLLVVPALIALAPLVTGVRFPAAGLLMVLVVGYLATGVFEEVWHRGVIQDTLRRLGLRRAAVVGGALFGLSHLANIAFGQPVAVSAAQAVGAFCFGFGFSVYRWRTNAVWLLAAIHAVGDLLFKITNLDGGLLWGFLIGHDVAMLAWALWCLRGVRDDLSDQPKWAPPATGSGESSASSSVNGSAPPRKRRT